MFKGGWRRKKGGGGADEILCANSAASVLGGTNLAYITWRREKQQFEHLLLEVPEIAALPKNTSPTSSHGSARPQWHCAGNAVIAVTRHTLVSLRDPICMPSSSFLCDRDQLPDISNRASPVRKDRRISNPGPGCS